MEKRYFSELKRAMELLAQDARTVFLGQAVLWPGTAMFNTVKDIDPAKRIELPVAEEMQMGMSTGMALAGFVPVSIYPRWNFLLLATNQIVNHLDKMIDMSGGGYRPRVIIRTAIGSVRPLDPQHQHRGDFTNAFINMCSTIAVERLEEADQIVPAYERALNRPDGHSTILVEYGDAYNER